MAFAQMQHTFAGKGVDAGTTATVVLQVGWLITCANVGDSLGFIDTGAEVPPAALGQPFIGVVLPCSRRFRV